MQFSFFFTLLKYIIDNTTADLVKPDTRNYIKGIQRQGVFIYIPSTIVVYIDKYEIDGR